MQDIDNNNSKKNETRFLSHNILGDRNNNGIPDGTELLKLVLAGSFFVCGLGLTLYGILAERETVIVGGTGLTGTGMALLCNSPGQKRD